MKNQHSLLAILVLLFLGISTALSAKVSLPALFTDHMVLQQKSEVAVWGWAAPLEKVIVIGSWNNKPVEAVADSYANWKVSLQTPAAGGPYTVTILGSNTIVLQDVLIGEVWLCSGQSNMEWSAKAGIDNATQEVLNANFPNIRFFDVANRSANVPQLDVSGTWTSCTPETMSEFSAIGYFFGRELYQNLNVPIGLINSSWGGTPAETWVNAEVIANDKALAAAATKIEQLPWCPEKPGQTYNAMIAPLIPYAIAGVLWYQGETNVRNYEVYEHLLSTLIQNWRNEWQRDLPFYYVQIAPYKYGDDDKGVQVREAQRKVLAVPNTGMVVVSDIGNIDDIHPRNKLDVGKRLANWALSKTCGKEGITVSGPLYRDLKKEGNKIRLSFDYADSGLTCKGGDCTHFELAGSNGKFVPATAVIDGKTILVSAEGIKDPTAVRFGWSNTAEPNLFNTEGLPASSFQAGN